MIRVHIACFVFLVLLLVVTSIQEPLSDPIPETFTAADDYLFEGKEFEHTDFRLKVVVIPDQKKFDELRSKINPKGNDVQAFSTINTLTNTCTIYVKDPTWNYSPEKLGHELAHCVWGRWHNGRDQKETALEGNTI